MPPCVASHHMPNVTLNRKRCFHLIRARQATTHVIYKSFQRFGDIVDIVEQPVRQEVRLPVQIVFATIIDARVIRVNDRIDIDGLQFGFKFVGFGTGAGGARHEQPLVADQLLVASADPTQNITSTLNDDCLREIFDLLGLIELCHVANTCRRFKQVASLCYRSKFAATYRHRLQISQLGRAPLLGSAPLLDSLATVELLVHTFGDDMHELHIDKFSTLNKEVALLICAEHCPNIRILRILGPFAWNATSKGALRRMLPQLDELAIGYFKGVEEAFGDDLPLKVLDVYTYHGYSMRNTVRLPQLVQLKLTMDMGYPNKPLFEKILPDSPRLRQLQFCGAIASPIYHALVKRYPALEKVSLVRCHYKGRMAKRLTEWGRLKRLRSLSIADTNPTLVPLAAICKALADGKVPLQRLSISAYSISDSAIECLQLERLQQIRLLNSTINTIPSEPQLRRLVESLTDLSAIVFKTCFLSVELVTAILQLMRHSANVSTRIVAGNSQLDAADYGRVDRLLKEHQMTQFELQLNGPLPWVSCSGSGARLSTERC